MNSNLNGDPTVVDPVKLVMSAQQLEAPGAVIDSGITDFAQSWTNNTGSTVFFNAVVILGAGAASSIQMQVNGARMAQAAISASLGISYIILPVCGVLLPGDSVMLVDDVHAAGNAVVQVSVSRLV